MTGAAIVGLMGVALAGISAWLAINGKDGSGWAFVATLLIVTSCSAAT